MGEIILKNAVKRKEGYLYYVDSEGNVCEAKMCRGGGRKGKGTKKKNDRTRPNRKSTKTN